MKILISCNVHRILCVKTDKHKKEIEKIAVQSKKTNHYNKFHIQITKTERKTKKHFNKEMSIAFLKQFAQKKLR